MTKIPNPQLMEKKHLQLLIEELENKKVFECRYPFECQGECGTEVDEGQDFYFIGDKKKICNFCRTAMIERLEELQ